jgi:hypothetical protein
VKEQVGSYKIIHKTVVEEEEIKKYSRSLMLTKVLLRT